MGTKGKPSFLHLGRENEHFNFYPQYPHNPQYSKNQPQSGSFTDITDKNEKVKNMSEKDRYYFEERAAIMEFDGGLSRREAEILARVLL